MAPACYDTGDGTPPPLETFYFPVGLRVSNGGTVLYAANSDFDLQYNGGTLQSYDLRLIRQHALLAIQNPTDPRLPLVNPAAPGCPSSPPLVIPGTDSRQPLGQTCAPPVASQFYFRDSAIIGAFATDLLLSLPPEQLAPEQLGPQQVRVHANDPLPPSANTSIDRLFVPVRGNATITWANVERDRFDSTPGPDATKETYPPFRIGCGQDVNDRCDGAHQAGEDPNEPGNSRHLTMPGEPFAAQISEDGTSIVLTHQNETKTSLFSTGLSRTRPEAEITPPTIQFIADNVPTGGMGIAQIPHDLDAFLGESVIPRPSYLETSRSIPQISLLRQYSDEFGAIGPASLPRPFINLEGAFPVTASAGGTDSRSIAIDPTPRMACKARVLPAGAGRTQEQVDAEVRACGRIPARAFIANRTPPALLIGDVGVTEGVDGTYDPDRLVIHTSIPLSAGASTVYLAPIVDRDGAYSLRVFAVCFDSATIFVYDPDAGTIENVLRVGVGPFAMAFDPFNLVDVATHQQVPIDPRDQALGLRRYRFGYVASFTQSYVQVIDLDNAVPNPATFERIVFTLGVPTNPKGT